MIELEENMDPNAVIKANTVKLHQQTDPPAKQSKKPHQPAPLVSEPVDYDQPKVNATFEKQKSGSSLHHPTNNPPSEQPNSRIHTEEGDVLINELEREQRII